MFNNEGFPTQEDIRACVISGINEDIEKLLNSIDLTDILQQCIDTGKNDQWSVMDAVAGRCGEIDEVASSGELLEYLRKHYTIGIDMICCDVIYATEVKIKRKD